MSMERNKDWTDVMRSALRNAEATPPADGWARLERELGSVPPPRKPLWRIPQVRIAAAAASVLLGIVAGELFRQAGPEEDYDLPVVASVETFGREEAAPTPDAEVAPSEKTTPAAPKRRAAGSASDARSLAVRTDASAAAPSAKRAVRSLAARVADHNPATEIGSEPEAACDKRDDPAEATIGSGAAQTAAAGSETATSSAAVSTETAGTAATASVAATSGTAETFASASTSETSATSATARSAGGSATEPAAARTSSRSAATACRTVFSNDNLLAYTRPSRKASLSLFAAGGITGSKSGSGLVSRSLAQLTGPEEEELEGSRYEDYRQSSFRHHQPMSFGLTVRKELGRGFSVETGVMYTLLWADVRMPLGTEDFSQKLHFIGVPVRVNWNFLERRNFVLYIGAGGMVEACAAAKFGSTEVEEPGVFWSVAGAVGAEYRLGGLVGLYFEPDLSYYFNQTRLRTSRTDSPATFTLRLGVRLNF